MDKKDHPIKEQAFIAGVTVIDFGDARVARGLSRREFSACNHRQMVYDPQERRIWCKDCERDVDPFDGFKILVEQFHAAEANIKRRRAQLEELEKVSIISRAAKQLDKIWRGRRQVPNCPHCKEALLPEFFADGCFSTGSAELARRRHGLAPTSPEPPE